MSEKIEERVKKDISAFSENLEMLRGIALPEDLEKIRELAKMYAEDAHSYMEKGDLVTSFSCISYAHGLLDAVLKIMKVDKYGI
jgi:Uncharacterized protein conserved in archaea